MLPVLWVLIAEWEAMSRAQAVDNDTNEHGVPYGGGFGGLALGKIRNAWLTAKGSAGGRTTLLLGLDGLEFLDGASWIGT